MPLKGGPGTYNEGCRTQRERADHGFNTPRFRLSGNGTTTADAPSVPQAPSPRDCATFLLEGRLQCTERLQRSVLADSVIRANSAADPPLADLYGHESSLSTGFENPLLAALWQARERYASFLHGDRIFFGDHFARCNHVVFV